MAQSVTYLTLIELEECVAVELSAKRYVSHRSRTDFVTINISE